MTKVTYRDGKKRQEMRLIGHAGDTDVCTAISAISQTLLWNMEREKEKGTAKVFTRMEIPGMIVIRARPGPESRDAIRQMFRFTAEGLRMVAEEYPDNITIQEEKEHGII